MTPRRVLITRATHQASSLAESLRAVGVAPILIPTIEFAEPVSFAPLDAALSSLDTFQWLLFTSANAVDAFHRRRRAAGSLALSHELSIAAIGAATARALETIGLTPTLIPASAVAESLAEALLAHARQPDGSSTRFLLVRAEQARDVLPDTLRTAGAEITIAPAYRTIIPLKSIPAIRDLFSSPVNYPDAVTFTSGSTATNLLALLEAASLQLPPEILRISIGPITSETLRDLNLPPHAEAAEPTIPSLVETLIQLLDGERAMNF